MKFHEIRSTFLYESNNRFRMHFMVLRPLPFSAVWKGTAAVQRCHWNWGACSCWTHSRRRVLHKRRDYRNPIGKGNTQQQRSLQTRDSMRLWPSEGENEIFFGWFHGNDAVTSCVRPSISEATENPKKCTRHLLHSADLWAARAEPEDCSFSWKACGNVFHRICRSTRTPQLHARSPEDSWPIAPSRQASSWKAWKVLKVASQDLLKVLTFCLSIFQVSVQVWHVAKSHAATTLPVPEGWQPPHFRDEVTASEWIPLHKNDKNDDMNIMNVDFNDFWTGFSELTSFSKDESTKNAHHTEATFGSWLSHLATQLYEVPPRYKTHLNCRNCSCFPYIGA